jgi:cytochrome c oxidase subunit II
MRTCNRIAPVLPTVLPAVLAGCSGVQSALDPAGREAAELLDLFWVMLIGAVVIWIALNGTFFLLAMVKPGPMSRRGAEALIIGGGVVFPTIGLAALLVAALPYLTELRPVPGEPSVRITGEKWWWRVDYLTEGGEVASANELRLPVGRRTEVSLGSDKVIHSFWIPSLSGKMDMFPGRETRISLEPFRAGTFRGQCAELCGTGHALMAFSAIVMEPAEFEAWLAREAGPAVPPADARARRGQDVFLSEGCGACHAIRGTPAEGAFGPDLTHVGSRLTIGAGTLPNTAEDFALWIAETHEVKPEVDMPEYELLGPEALADLAHYLDGLL